MNLAEHPTVQRWRRTAPQSPKPSNQPLDAAWLRQLLLDAGADDVGFVEIDRPEIGDQRDDLLACLPRTKTLVSYVVRMNRSAVRAPARSVANLEFHHAGDAVNEVARKVVRTLEVRGVAAVNPAMGFPMEMDRFPGKIWVVSHKPVAVAAGLGRMGIHRNVIHAKFGNFILLGTVLIDAEVSEYDRPLDYNPCVECKLCVAACPVGAIAPDGGFNFSACYTHNYREFMGGFTDWVETIAESGSAKRYREKVTDAESVSMWQSLSFGANYKAAYCMAVCPAGEEVIGPYLSDKRRVLEEVVRPLQDKKEPIYVVPGSDAEEHVTKRFPHKTARPVGNGLRPASIRSFLDSLPLSFQRGASKGIAATYHFTFTGEEEKKATVEIRDQRIDVSKGHRGTPDFRLTADSRTWLRFLAKNVGLARALLTRKIRFRGSPKHLREFARCFPS